MLGELLRGVVGSCTPAVPPRLGSTACKELIMAARRCFHILADAANDAALVFQSTGSQRDCFLRGSKVELLDPGEKVIIAF